MLATALGRKSQSSTQFVMSLKTSWMSIQGDSKKNLLNIIVWLRKFLLLLGKAVSSFQILNTGSGTCTSGPGGDCLGCMVMTKIVAI